MLPGIKETTDFILSKINNSPEIGIILGTGMGAFADTIVQDKVLNYRDIPNFPVSTISGHAGRLIFGKIGHKQVMAMQGRFHFYEGYSMKEITFPIRVMKFLGIKLLILSNASGGLNPHFKIGDCMIITDHINLMGTNPLIGFNDDTLGPRFPDMKETYSKTLVEKAIDIANKIHIPYRTGVYAGVTGPTYETPAEYKYIRRSGADAVGMSTVPEAIVAKHMGISVFAVSVISDLGVPGKIVEISHQDVLDASSRAEPHVAELVRQLITEL
jgi:purine-nucleoside phosphorylase